MFTRPAITPPVVYRFGWNLEYSQYIGAGPDRFWVRSAQKREREIEPIFCELNNARLRRFPVSQISRNLRKRRGAMSPWILSGNIFENLPVTELFSKKATFSATVFSDFGLHSAISPKWSQISESHDRLASLRNVDFPFVPLESSQSHSPGLQAAYKKRHSWTSPAVPSSAADVMSQSHSHGGTNKLTLTLHYC